MSSCMVCGETVNDAVPVHGDCLNPYDRQEDWWVVERTVSGGASRAHGPDGARRPSPARRRRTRLRRSFG